MNRKVIYLILLFFFAYVKALAQDNVYFQQTEVGFLWGKGLKNWEGGYENRLNLTFSTFHGAKINPNHVLGFSTGLDQYDQINLIPIALGWRGFLGKEGKPRLFAGLDLGGGAAFLEKKETTDWSSSWYEGGMMVSPTAGVKFPAKRGKWALSTSIGYKRQQASFLQGFFDRSGLSSFATPGISRLPNGFSSLNETNYLFHSLVFRMGVMF
ncbi:hypothetical protein [Algoriphagus sp. AK58]|uniref:hypothetical protein n=1 Tax=Algoriphagus sp. AK58 TaxID=1406877 RepID=UPI001650A98D|nr:hypothetical protein [Algoriphagus sp. AK58]MBC6366750.1 hypothetical protein [Algoriphagus sp. AK58]